METDNKKLLLGTAVAPKQLLRLHAIIFLLTMKQINDIFNRVLMLQHVPVVSAEESRAETFSCGF